MYSGQTEYLNISASQKKLERVSFMFLINCVSFIVVTKFIRTGIAEKDDYPLYFDKAFYETEVDENEEINHSLLTVTARTHNECKLLLHPFIIKIKYFLKLPHVK